MFTADGIVDIELKTGRAATVAAAAAEQRVKATAAIRRRQGLRRSHNRLFHGGALWSTDQQDV